MPDDFYPVPGGTAIAAEALGIPRARALLDAVHRHRDFRLIEVLRLPAHDGVAVVGLIVDMTCDGVPKKNDYGLQYRERLALVVSPDRNHMPDVFALRREFPRLAHQNRVAPDSPAHLCLYFEPAAAVLRSWTPESFLRRILWWFEKNARGELHLADQPLDHLFFASKYELVLPWNFDTARQTASEWVIARGEERPNGGMTFFLLPKERAVGEKVTTANLVELTLPPVVSGAVELDPGTLGQLTDMLHDRDVELLPALSEQLRGLVDHQGTPVRANKPFTVVLLHVPLCRHTGGAIEDTTHRAFLLSDDPLEVGVATGALMKHEGRYFNAVGVLEPEASVEWRSFRVRPVGVLRQNTPALARTQSGVGDPGPTGVMVGAGALGSALLNLWGRCGWGTWTAIDTDHVKPHNLSRHTATAEHLGEPKAMAVASLHHAVWQGASELKPLVADACDDKNPSVASALQGATLVIDASTTLEYPRYASQQAAFPRHASTFLTPTANAAVALIEDVTRMQPLRTLEAQYYRALLQNDWGREHLAENLSAFWSGASCRDISLVLPYARVMGHASTLADRLPALLASDQATIRVWQHTDDRGGLAVHEVPVEHERHLALDDLHVFWDAGLERELRELRRQHLPRETGGVLLGYYDFNVQALVLVAALPAPPDSTASGGAFERGIEGLKATTVEVSRRTAGIVGYVGEWHSHPPGYSATPSRDDWIQLVHLALGMGDDGLPGVQLIVGERDMHVLTASCGLS